MRQAARNFLNLRLRLIAGLFGLYRQTGFLAKARDWSDQLESELPSDGRIAPEVLSTADQLAIVYVWLELDRRTPAETLARGLVDICHAALDKSAESLRALASVDAGLGDVLLRADQAEQAHTLYAQVGS